MAGNPVQLGVEPRSSHNVLVPHVQYRSVQKNKAEDEMERINANPQMWHVQNVLHYLHAIVEKSNINTQLVAFRDNTDIAEVCHALHL